MIVASTHPPASTHVTATSDLIASERLLSEPRTVSGFRICIAGVSSKLHFRSMSVPYPL